MRMDNAKESSSSSYSSCSSDSENNGDIEYPNVFTLKPFDFEPEISLEEQQQMPNDSSESDSNESPDEECRIGNTDWCKCGCCQPMQTYTESLCCKDTNEIPEKLFDGKQFRGHIIEKYNIPNKQLK